MTFDEMIKAAARLGFLLVLLACHVRLSAQVNKPEVQRLLEAYRELSLQEKVFVHTDRSFYLTGDYLWVKVYVVDASLHKPLSMSKVVYLEVLDSDNHPLMKSKVAMHDGTGNTALFLPATLNSGNYIIRAYTRWMQNYSPDFFFHRTVTIVNPFKPLNLKSAAEEGQYDVQFFPEGGQLVDSLTSRVGFRIVDRLGHGLDNVTGLIVDEKSDTVKTFRPLRFGLGNFVFTPTYGTMYRAIVKDSLGRILSVKNLPTVGKEGYVMAVNETSHGSVEVSVSSRSLHLQRPAQVWLLVHNRFVVSAVESKRIANGQATFELEKERLGDGISQITLFDEKENPLCERLFFKVPGRTLHIDGTLEQKTIAPRRKVTLDILSAGSDGQPEAASLSVSVFQLDSLQREDEVDIVNYLLLTSDLAGNVESPSYYLSNAPDAGACIDNLMLTHGWRRFKWGDVIQEKGPAEMLAPEYRGHILTGNIVSNADQEPAAGIPVYLSIPGKQFHLRGAKSNRTGNLTFELVDFFGPNKVIVQTNWSKDSVYRITLDDPFSNRYSELYPVPGLTLNSRVQNSILSRSINMQLDNSYLADVKGRPVIPGTDSTAFYRQPNDRYYLDDYTRFGVMEEVMREYVPGVLVRRKKKDFYFRVLNRKVNELFSDNPLVLLDGVPIFNINTIMAYDPLKVWRLDVVTNRYFYGALTFDGIVSYSTYAGDMADFTLDDRALVQDYDGMSWQREFFSPVYETAEQAESRIPDFRNLLYWSPDVHTGKGGKKQLVFYSGDVSGRFLINIQGISGGGEPGSKQLYLEVVDRESD